MGVAGSPPAERAGGRHRQIAGPGGDTRIRCAAGTAGEEHWVRECWRPGEWPPMQELEKRELLIHRKLVAANVPSNLISNQHKKSRLETFKATRDLADHAEATVTGVHGFEPPDWSFGQQIATPTQRSRGV